MAVLGVVEEVAVAAAISRGTSSLYIWSQRVAGVRAGELEVNG
jgi:hypothetical protein